MAKHDDQQPTEAKDEVKKDTEELYVLVDGYGTEPLKLRGEKVTVTAAEAEHGKKTGALGSQEDLKHAELAAESGISDESITAMGLLELNAFLSGHSDDVTLARVESLEYRRAEGPRDEVTQIIDTVRSLRG